MNDSARTGVIVLSGPDTLGLRDICNKLLKWAIFNLSKQTSVKHELRALK